MIIIADIVGLAVLGGILAVIRFLFWPVANGPDLPFLFAYFILAIVSLFMWH